MLRDTTYPTQVHICSEVRAKGDWCHVRCVSYGNSLEDTPVSSEPFSVQKVMSTPVSNIPRKAGQAIASKQHPDIDGEKGNE